MGATELSILPPQESIYFPDAVFRPATATDVPVLVYGAVSQTANLTEWRTVDGTLRAYVAAGGGIHTSGDFTTTSAGSTRLGDAPWLGATLQVQARAVDNRAIIVRGLAGQSVSLLEAQDSTGTVVSSISQTGNIVMQGGTANLDFDAKRVLYVGGGGWWGSMINVQAGVYGGPGTKGILVRGGAGQTGNLIELQNTGATVVTSLSPHGSIVITGNASADTERLVILASSNQTQSLTEWRNSASSMQFRVTNDYRLSWAVAGAIRGISGGLELAANNNSSPGGGFVRSVGSLEVYPNRGDSVPDISLHNGFQGQTSGSVNNGWIRFVGPCSYHGEMTWHPGERYFRFRQSGGAVFDGWAYLLANQFYAQSTEDSKENIQTLDVGGHSGVREIKREFKTKAPAAPLAQRFKNLRPVSYRSKGDPASPLLHSFVAEEAFDTVPEIVAIDGEGKPTGINLMATISILTAMVQDQQKRIEELEAR